MKPPDIFLFAVLLTGCAQLSTPPESPETAEVVEQRQEAVERSAEQLPAPEDNTSPSVDESAQEPQYLPVADWLVQRRSVCSEGWKSIQIQLNRYQDMLTQGPQPEEQEVVHAYTQLKALMLATCNPARTPGVLKNLLDRVDDYEWPAEYSALIDLLKSEYSAYALLEARYKDLRARHQKTIDGIGNIEQSLEDTSN